MKSLAVVLVAIALVGAVACARGETYSMKDGEGNSIQLFDEPCYGTPPWMGWHRAAMLYHGKSYEACWRVFGNTVLVLDSDGDASPVPIVAFKKDEGV